MNRLDGATVAIQSPSESHPYSWEEAYKAALLEPDNALLEKRIRAAEEVLVSRWLELTNLHEYGGELQALVDALKGLRHLKQERVGP